MINAYNTSTNYHNNFNKNNLPNQKVFKILKTEPNYLKPELRRNRLKSNNEVVDNIISKALSKKKRRGILDMCSPGNKDILTDSDSECPSDKYFKNKDIKTNNMEKKNKCTKLIIEKVESQKPKINVEYYKFTNQKIFNKINNFNLKNKILDNNKFERFKSPTETINSNAINSYFNINIDNNNNNNKVNKLGIRKKKNIQIHNPVKYENYLDNNNFILNSNYNNKNNNNNYSQNKVLTTEASSKDNNYNSNNNNLNNKNRIIGRMSIELNNKSNNQMDISPIIPYSKESSIEKNSNTINIKDYKIINSNDNNFREMSLNTPTNVLTPNNEESIQTKKSIIHKQKVNADNKVLRPGSILSHYNNLVKRSRMRQLEYLNSNINNSKGYLQNNFNKKLNKSATIIQSFWRGFFIRELYIFTKKLKLFINNISKILDNYRKKEGTYFLNLIKNLESKKNKSKINKNIKGIYVKHKYTYKHEKNDTINQVKNNEENTNYTIIQKKDDDYQKLLGNYNSLMEKYNKMKEEMNKIIKKKNKFDGLDIENNNLVIINKIYKKSINENMIFRKKNINKNEIQKIDKKDTFEILKPEKKEELKIIQKLNSSNNLKYRKKNPVKKKIEKIEKIIDFKYDNIEPNNNKNINYENYLNHFVSNINIIYNSQFAIDEIPPINKKILPSIPLDIYRNSFTLTNKECIKFDKVYEIRNSQITIINNINEQITNLKETKIKLIEENQKNANILIEGFEIKNKKLFEDYVVDEHNININIIQTKKQKEFDKKQNVIKNDILLNIISDNKTKKSYDEQQIFMKNDISINIICEYKKQKHFDKEQKTKKMIFH